MEQETGDKKTTGAEKGTFYFSMSARITDRVFEPDDDALGQNEVPYLLKDLYTVAGLADERGWPVERYDYDAYGKVHMNRCAVLPWAADFDGDGDLDQNDLTVFLDAYGGSGEAPNGPCGWRADLDGDGDVDGSDYLLFADAYNGAGNPPRRPQSPAVSAGCVLTSGPMVASRVGNPFFFTGRRLDVIDKQDAGTPHHFTDDYSGLQLYDYRARTMDPVLGRLDQIDPIGYLGGLGLYAYAAGNPLTYTDPTGLILDIPAEPGDSKCLTVAFVLGAGSSLPLASPWEWKLFWHWLRGMGFPMDSDPDMDVFDSGGKQRREHMSHMNEKLTGAGRNLGCEQTYPYHYGKDEDPGIGNGNAFSEVKMISHYRFWFRCDGWASKTCDKCNRCKSIAIAFTCGFHARDFIDFENTPNPFGMAGIYFTDRLVRRCFPSGVGFDIKADQTKSATFTLPCDRK